MPRQSPSPAVQRAARNLLLAKLWGTGPYLPEIARAIGATTRTTLRVAHQLGLPPLAPPRKPAQRLADLPPAVRLDLAWLGGVLDSRGCVSCQPSGTGWGSPRLSLSGAASLVRACQRISRVGKISRGSWVVDAQGQLVDLAWMVRPYLRTRRSLADLLVSWPVLGTGQRPTPHQIAERDRIARAIQEQS